MNTTLKVLWGILAVVVAVVAVVIVSISRGRAEYAKGKSAELQLSSFAKMADIYQLDTNEYPESLEDLVRPPNDVAGWRGPYGGRRRGIPLDDPWGRPYRVERGERGDKIHVRFASDGPDGKPETEDDIEKITDCRPVPSVDDSASTEPENANTENDSETEVESVRVDGTEASDEVKELIAGWEGDKREKIDMARMHIYALCRRAEEYRLIKGDVPKMYKDIQYSLAFGQQLKGTVRVPLMPDPWGFYYRVEPIDSTAVRVASNGPDQQPGTDDDIARRTDEGDTKRSVTEDVIDKMCVHAEIHRIRTGEDRRRISSLQDSWVPGSRRRISSLQDSWGNPFRFEQLDPNTLTVASNGPDGEPDTKDDIEISTNESIRKRASMVVITQHQILFKRLASKFFRDTGEHPKSLVDFAHRPENFVDSSKWRGPYLKQIPKDPWGNKYRITMKTSGARTYLTSGSDGPDGIPGTEDDIGAR